MPTEEALRAAPASVARKRSVLVALGIALLYLALSGICIETATPWNDEAWYTSPSLNLISNGTTGTPYLETAGRFWKGINERTYWVAPVYFFAQVPWFEVVGFSLRSATVFAVCWGLVALLCWGLIAYKLTEDVVMALLTMGLIACDYQFVT